MHAQHPAMDNARLRPARRHRLFTALAITAVRTRVEPAAADIWLRGRGGA